MLFPQVSLSSGVQLLSLFSSPCIAIVVVSTLFLLLDFLLMTIESLKRGGWSHSSLFEVTFYSSSIRDVLFILSHSIFTQNITSRTSEIFAIACSVLKTASLKTQHKKVFESRFSILFPVAYYHNKTTKIGTNKETKRKL